MKKFRAWDKKQKQMVTNFVIAPTSPGWSAFNFDSSLSDEIEKIYKNLCGDTLAWAGDYSVIDWGNWYGIEEYAIMQFTGLLDKNGNQVFEGDIVESVSELINISTNKPTGRFKTERFEVRWEEDKARWGRFAKGKFALLYGLEKKSLLEWYTVIGNIYENGQKVDK